MADPARNAGDGRRRVVIEAVTPDVDGGRFPAKRVVGEEVVVEADVLCDGHDVLSAVVRYRHASGRGWHEAPMRALEDDRRRGRFTVTELGRYRFTVRAWTDRFESWRRDFGKKVDAGQDVAIDLLSGADLVEAAVERSRGGAKVLRRFLARMRD